VDVGPHETRASCWQGHSVLADEGRLRRMRVLRGSKLSLIQSNGEGRGLPGYAIIPIS
jgi:hypothetical protein